MITNVKELEDGSNHQVTWKDGTVSTVPPNHRFMQNVREWVDAGNTIEAYVPPTADELLQQERQSMQVSRFQARAALSQAGMLADVQTYMDDVNTPEIERLAWQDAQSFKRLSPTIVNVGTSLGLTDIQMDELFRTAATIEA